MSVTATKYDAFWTHMAAGRCYWTSDTIKIALLTSNYTPVVATDSVWADISADELASGGGYTTGGIALAGKTASSTKLDADDVVWSDLTADDVGVGVIYRVGAINGVTDPLLGYVDPDASQAALLVISSDFTIRWNTVGVFTLA